MSITINIDNLITNKDLSGISTLYKELYNPTDFNCDIIFSSDRASLNLTIAFPMCYKYWALLINRSSPKTTFRYNQSFLNNTYQNVSAIIFLIDVVLTHKTADKIIDYLSDITREVDGFNIFPVANS